MCFKLQLVRSIAVLVAAGLVISSGCGGGSDVPSTNIPSASNAKSDSDSTGTPRNEDPVTLVATNGEFQSPAQGDTELHPEVSIKTNLGTIRLRLDWGKSPRTVSNFLYNYVETGFYDQTLVHYVESGYLIALGGYGVDGKEKPTQPPIPCEANNGLVNKRGTISMARQPGFANSATSQFFINLVDNPGLDYKATDADGINGYCVFGEVIEGLEIVEKIALVQVHDKDDLVKTPLQPVVVESITRTK